MPHLVNRREEVGHNRARRGAARKAFQHGVAVAAGVERLRLGLAVIVVMLSRLVVGVILDGNLQPSHLEFDNTANRIQRHFRSGYHPSMQPRGTDTQEERQIK